MAAKKGKNSLQYTCVRENLVDLTGYLQHNTAARIHLVRQFQSKDWLAPGENVDPDALLTLVLERIRVTPDEYDSFVAMLEEVVGTENIVKTLRGTVHVYVPCILEIA